MGMNYYDSEGERRAAITRGDTTRKESTVSGDGRHHYAVTAYGPDGDRQIVKNLTNTPYDDLGAAEYMAATFDRRRPDGIDGFAGERIA